jgi:hypothetical protein
VQAEILPEAVKHLLKRYQRNLSKSIFEMYRQGNIVVVSSTTIYMRDDRISVFISIKRNKRKHSCKNTYCQHPGGVFDFSWVGFDVSMVECAAAMHINFVIIPQMVNKVRDITGHRTLRTSVWAIIWSKAAQRFMLYLAIVWEDLWAPQRVVLTGKLKRFGYFLQCQTPDITELLSASRATIVYPSFACGTQSMSILAL